MREPQRTALVDVSVFRLGQTTDVLRVPLNSGAHARELIGIRRKPPLPPDQHWRQRQVEAMPTMARVVGDGRLTLVDSTELSLEEIKGTYVGVSGIAGDLFRDVRWSHVPAAIERSKFQKMDMDSYTMKETVVAFCKILLGFDCKAVAARPRFLQRFTDFEQKNLLSLDRFRQICAALSENHYPDALHLWTAEVNRLDYFLTADRAFINVMTKTSRIALTTRPIAPVDLLEVLGVTEMDPMPIADDNIRPL
jgi:hypothetical protein